MNKVGNFIYLHGFTHGISYLGENGQKKYNQNDAWLSLEDEV